MKSYLIKVSVFLCLFFALFFIASRDNEAYKTGSWRSSLYVDPAGYNVYLPATFQHAFIHNFPEKTDSIVAYGFMLNKDKKVITKFTYGVALMQSPFYIAGLVISKAFGIENSGYSYFNQVLIDVIGISYACIAIMLLYFLLCRFFSKTIAFFSTLIIFVGTNTFYYATIQPGMSHIYSFFLVILAVHCVLNYTEGPSFKRFLFLSFIISLIILVRPINIILGLPILFFNVNGLEEVKKRLKLVFTLLNCFVFISTLFLVFLPQFIYWKFTYGSFIADSYPGEGFTYLSHPQIKQFLLSPHNGLLVYSPLYFVLFVLLLLLFKKHKAVMWSSVFTFSLLIYLSSAWYLFFFGCGFGGRNFVEYSGLFAFPLGICLQNHFKKAKAFVISIIIIFCIFINLKLIYSWDLCFWGKNDWAWKEYKYLLNKPHKVLKQNPDSLDAGKITLIGNEKVYKISPEEVYAPGFEFNQHYLSSSYFKIAKINVDIMPLDSNSRCQLVCMAFLNDSIVFYNVIPISEQKNAWKNYVLQSGLPFDEEKNHLIKIFIMNNEKHTFYFKNLKVELE